MTRNFGVRGGGCVDRPGPGAFGLALLLGCFAAGISLGASPAQAQEPAPQAPAAEDAAGEGEASFPKVSIHGFLSQAYAFSDGNQILGIPDQGTADYRTAALLIRADISPDDVFSIQLSHERNGLSPLQKTQADVKLDWAFYEHRFGKSAVKVGRVKAPYGIYNEVRDVGTVLPLYRPPRDIYGEGSFTTETIDGILVSHRFDLSQSWALSADLYYGNWSFVDTTGAESQVEKTFGGQLFLDTPVPGLRLGVGFLRFDASAVPARPATYWQDVHASIQASFGRVEADVEYKKTDADLQQGGKLLYGIEAGYARLGFRVTDKLTVHAQAEQLKIDLAQLRVKLDYETERVLALTYKFRADLVLKAEHHWNKGYFLDTPVNVLGPAPKTNYGILSLSTSF